MLRIRGILDSVGINLGAPGNRKPEEVLWLEYPRVYGKGGEAPAKISASSGNCFRNHFTCLENNEDGQPWAASYGLEGLDSMQWNFLPGEWEVSFHDTALYFAEPKNTEPGERVFDILLDGERLLEGVDVSELAGVTGRGCVSRVERFPMESVLETSFEHGKKSLPPVLSGIEIIRSSRPLKQTGDLTKT